MATTITGKVGNDILTGTTGDDTLVGGAGNDTLNGGSGSDTYLVSGVNDGFDLIQDSGSGGFDRVVAGADGTRIGLRSFGPGSGIEEISADGHAHVAVVADSGNDVLDFSATVLTDIESIDGGSGNDTIIGSAGNDTIVGGRGDDLLAGGSGSDTYVFRGAAEGFDTVSDTGASGTDRMIAGADGTRIGLKAFSAASGIEEISANGYADVAITGDGANNTLDFSAATLTGITSIDGGAGYDTIIGSAGDDIIVGGAGNDVLDGGAGSDTYLVRGTGDGIDTIADHGTTGTDRIVAGADGTRVSLTGFSGASGIEEISANGFANVAISGDGGNNVLDFSTTKLTGIASIDGGAGYDTITGSTGDDIIVGGVGNDLMRGGAGNDTFIAGAGVDTAFGGAGTDTLVLSGNASAYTVKMLADGGFMLSTSLTGEGSETIYEVERVQFADGTFTVVPGQGLVPVGVVPADSAASAPDVRAANAAGNEDGVIALDLSAQLTDLDGSESLSVTLSGLPQGATLSAGTRNPDGSWSLTGDQLAGLQLAPPADFSGQLALKLTATATEANGGATATTSAAFTVAVAAVADTPVVAVTSVAGQEDRAIALDLAARLTDVDGSESLRVTISGVPEGASLSAGVRNTDGSWTLTGGQLSGLTLTPPDDYSGQFNLTVRATATEANGSSASASSAFSVTVAAVADAPVIVADDVKGKEDTVIALDLSARLADLDGSESLSVTLSGVPQGASLSAGTHNPDGTWTLTADQLAGLTLVPPADFSGRIDLTLAATATERNGSVAKVSEAFAVTVEAVADAPIVVASNAATHENSTVALDIQALLTDTDGSETLSVTLSGLPEGAVLSAGTPNADGTWTLGADELPGLRLTPPYGFSGDFLLSITATATEASNSSTATTLVSMTVVGAAEAPTLTVNDVAGSEDSAISLDISAHLVDLDGSETLSVMVSGLPKGATLSAGVANGDGSWTLTGDQLNGLKLVPPANFSGDLNLSVTATATEDNGDTASTTNTFVVAVAGRADAPMVSAANASGIEDGSIALNLSAQLTDLDGSESLAVTLAGLPAGSTLSAGTRNPDGSWSLTADQLHGLKLAPPANFSGALNLTLTATATEADGDAASVSRAFTVAVTGVADAPVLAVANAKGSEDTAIALDLSAHLTDVDGSESLAVTISGLPAGAVLSAGTLNPNGSWTLAANQLAGLKVTPPANFSGQMNLAVTATATEANGSTATTASTAVIAVAGVADTPSLSVGATAHGLSGSPITLNIGAGLTDVDGSETLAVRVTGLPDGFTLSAGTANADGSWLLNASQLSGLTVTAPVNFSGQLNLGVTATATETASGSSAVVSSTVAVIVASAYPLTPTIVGTGADDRIVGTAGQDVINGGAGADTMIGGAGNDSYFVDNVNDVVSEAYGQGVDTVYSAVSYRLPTGYNVENLTLVGTGDLSATGNAAANVLTGNSGNNVLDGQGGADTMMGGDGNDTYYAYDSGDVVVENANGGIDTVHTNGTYNVAGANVENIIHDATWGVRLTGNELDNALTGNSGGDSLFGGAGNDTLTGGAGNDYLDGGDGNDTAVFSGNRADYTITKTATGFTVSGVDGNDSVVNVETLRFADQSVNLAQFAPTPTATVTNSAPTSSVGTVIHPQVVAASEAGDIVGFTLENNTDTTAPSGYVTFGQVFVGGDVHPGDHLVARINGVDVPVQMDVKALNDDGSVRHAILTVQAPAIAAGGEVSMMLHESTTQSAQSAITASDVLAKGVDLQVSFGIHNADGTVTQHDVDAAAVLREAIKAGTVETWLSGAQASEFRVESEVSPGLRVTFDIRGFADGTVRTDVIVANDSTYTAGVTSYDYDVKVVSNGTVALSSDDLHHNQNATWHTEVWQGTEPVQHVVRDVNYLVETGAVPAYDTSVGVDSQEIQADLAALAKADTGPMGNALVTEYLPQTGFRSDIGIETEWTARYVMSQDEGAEKVMLANADAAGSIPWHFRDEATGEAVRVDDHPNLWLDPRGADAKYGSDALPEAYSTAGTGWTVDTAHRPALTYAPYLFTGSHYYSDELTYQASSSIAAISPGYGRDSSGELNFDTMQVRGIAWVLRDLGDAAYILPDDHPLKVYFNDLIDTNLDKIVTTYVTKGALDAAGELEGFLFGTYGDANAIAPWQQDYLASTMNYLAERGFEQAKPILEWMDTFMSGRYTSGDEGFDPIYGAAYNLTVRDAATGAFYDTWSEVLANSTHLTYDGNAATSLGNSNSASGYAAVAKAAIAGVISSTGSVDAIEAFGYIATQTVSTNVDEVNDGTWAITPKMKDGTHLTAANTHVYNGSADTTMTGTAATELLHGGSGNDKISGDAGIDMLFGGSGNDILDGGSGDDYLFGGDGADTLVGGSGNDTMKGGNDADTFSISGGGHDVITDFAVGVDQLAVQRTADGPQTVDELVAGATQDANGNVVLHLGAEAEVTLLGVRTDELHASWIHITN